jgi:hypothetical protein
MPSFYVPEGVNQIVLRFPGSSRTMPALMSLLAILLIATGTMGDFPLLERVLRGLAGAVALGAFLMLLWWNLSFRVVVDHEGLLSQSIFGVTRIGWQELGPLDHRTVKREVPDPMIGRPNRTTSQTLARYLIVRDASGLREIKLRDDLVPMGDRKRVVEMLQAAVAQAADSNTASTGRDPATGTGS